MDKTNHTKSQPEVKPWVRRVVAAAGVVLPATADGEKRLGWWGVEMAKFLRFCKSMPEGTDLRPAMEGYGRYLKGAEPPLQDWQLDQAREALRCLQKGIENWSIGAANAEGNVEVGFRVKTRTGEDAEMGRGGDTEPGRRGEGVDAKVGGWLTKSERSMKVRHMAVRTVETYLGWQRRYLKWVMEQGLEPASQAGVEGFLTWLAVERKVSAATQNQALSAVIFLTTEVMEQPVEGVDAVRARRSRHLPVVLSREEVRRLMAVLEGTTGLCLKLIYGTGLRQMECLRLRVKDVDLDRKVIVVREGKGGKDRQVMLPAVLAAEMAAHAERLRALQEADRAADLPGVWLPGALEVKYPSAGKELAWQWFFPSKQIGTDPETGVRRRHHLHENALTLALKTAQERAGLTKKAGCHTLRHSFDSVASSGSLTPALRSRAA